MSRFAIVGVVGGLTAACSTDTIRFTENPFSNPFKTADSGTDPVRTGSIDEPGSAAPMPRSSVRSEALAPVRTAQAPAAPAPRTASPAPVTARPATSGPGGWSTVGGTPITVGSGDSIAIISNRYGVPASAILSANNVSAAQVTTGRRLVIPVYAASGDSSAPRLARTTEAAPAPVPAAGRVVSSSRIDAKKPVPKTVAEASETRIKPRPGQPTIARAPEPVRAPVRQAEAKPQPKIERAPPLKVAKAEPVKPAAAKPEPKPARVAKAEPTPKPEPVKVAKVEPKPAKVAKAEAPAKPAPAPTPAPVEVARAAPVAKEPESTGAISTAAAPVETGPGFRWPARGRVISGFGGGGSNEGINIAVPDGTPVKAAGDGVVAYAGSEVKGYGNLVLIRHDNGYVSAYAHNGDIDVKRGQKVARGQTIAKSGQSGNVTSPQLHFEIRKGSTPVDPSKYLASAN